MKKNKLIAKQQLEIEELNLHLEEASKVLDSIYSLLYCIGGPLNDNVQRYTKPQLGIFGDILQTIERASYY